MDIALNGFETHTVAIITNLIPFVTLDLVDIHIGRPAHNRARGFYRV
jgi:hypothetical protein